MSDDWAKGVAKIKYAFTIELSPSTEGVDAKYGFLLPEDKYNLSLTLRSTYYALNKIKANLYYNVYIV